MERLTQRAKKVLSLAHQEAERMRHGYIGTEHLLLGLIIEDGGVASRVLRELGLEVKRVTELVERLSAPGTESAGKPELSPGTQEVLQFAFEEAKQLGKSYVSTEHLLLGLIRVEDSIAMQALRKAGLNAEQIRRQTRRVLQEGTTTSRPSTRRPAAAKKPEKKQGKTPLIDQLATDLTAHAEEGKLDPVIGRQMEIERVIQ
ncbi:MAG: Clp protease N-terminal domain-containing protein, partial [Anaerolineales bacterium]